ncbi:MAG: ABC transporter ATP-binding protein [Micrococcales bacterium]|nr:ABC transporter ATP-binding protein [Micrococcales bacterium]
MTPPVVELRDIGLEYPVPGGAVRALDSVSLQVHAADSVAVVGRSGSGKSSLVSVLGLMRTPTSGAVLLDGDAVGAGHRDRRRARAGTVAMVFQSFHLEPHLTATENCMLPWYCGISTGPSRAARHRARELISAVGLAHLSDRRVADMSGGERQRVAIARALFVGPRLLIADEPTGNLDEETAEAVTALLWDLPVTTGAAVLVVTHDASVASGARRLVHLVRGRVAFEGIGAGGAR